MIHRLVKSQLRFVYWRTDEGGVVDTRNRSEIERNEVGLQMPFERGTTFLAIEFCSNGARASRSDSIHVNA